MLLSRKQIEKSISFWLVRMSNYGLRKEDEIQFAHSLRKLLLLYDSEYDKIILWIKNGKPDILLGTALAACHDVVFPEESYLEFHMNKNGSIIYTDGWRGEVKYLMQGDNLC